MALCGKIELEISQLEPADATAFLADLGLSESGLDRVIRASYDLLGYMSFFTVGEDECRAWSIARGTPAQLAAGEIHTDIQRGFIRAEVVAYDALTDARQHGRVPRARRGAPRRQGIRRAGRGYHQLPPRHLIDRERSRRVLVLESQTPFVHGGAEMLARELRRRAARATAARPSSCRSRFATRRARSCWPTPPRGGCSI